MQAGMLFHAVSAGCSGVDVEQVAATLHEPLDEALFLRTWQRAAERHPIVRCASFTRSFLETVHRNLKGAANGYENH